MIFSIETEIPLPVPKSEAPLEIVSLAKTANSTASFASPNT
jgi:hypothetical protein